MTLAGAQDRGVSELRRAVKAGVDVCKPSGAILNREKALTLGLVAASAVAAEKSGDAASGARLAPRNV